MSCPNYVVLMSTVCIGDAGSEQSDVVGQGGVDNEVAMSSDNRAAADATSPVSPTGKRTPAMLS